jgi:phage gp36-like protein
VPLPSPAYTNEQAVRLALAPDGDPSVATAASLDDPALQDAITEAQQEIDSRLAGRYPVPFGRAGTPYPDVPPIIAMVARDFAAWNATLTASRSMPIPDGHPALRRYQRAEARLQDLVSGKAELAQTAAEETAGMPAETPTSGADVENSYSGDLWSLDSMSIGAGSRTWPFGWERW